MELSQEENSKGGGGVTYNLDLTEHSGSKTLQLKRKHEEVFQHHNKAWARGI